MKRRVDARTRKGRLEQLFAAFFVAGMACAAQGPGPLYTLSTVTGTDPSNLSGRGGAESLAQDRQRNLYIGQRGGGVLKIDPTGKVIPVAGRGVPGFSTDGAPGTIQLGGSIGVAVDDNGVLYIADTDHHRVLKMMVGGAVTTFAGTGVFDGTGDGGPATAASIAQPFGLALDRQGNLYIGEYGGCRVRRVGTDGVISTYAGTGKFGYNGDGIRAKNANLCPWGLAFDEAGDLYIGDYGGYRVRKVTPDGMIHTVAGTGKGGYNGDGIPATRANISSATGVSVDRAGNLFIADGQNQRVRKVTPDGMISTVAGTGVLGILLGDGRAATLSQLTYPVGVLADNAGNLYIADGRVRTVDNKGKLKTIQGFETSDDGGSASTAQLCYPTGIALDSDRNIYVTDTAGRRVRKIDQQGLIHTVAGDGEQGYAGDGIAATEAPLNDPRGIAVDGEGNLYIADAGNNRIRKVGSDGMISTVAGTGAAGFSGDGGNASSAQLSNPTGVALDGKGNLDIADTGNNRIRKVTPDGIIVTIAGAGAAGYGGDGGAATDAQLSSPSSITVDAAGNLYIADTENHVVREVLAKGIITTVAGTGIQGRSDDGGFATASMLFAPVSVAVDEEGTLFIADESRIRRLRRGDTIDTVAGSGGYNYYDYVDGGPGFILALLAPQGMAFDGAGNFYFSDVDLSGGQNTRVRKATVLRSSGFGAPPVILPQAIVNAANLSRAPVAPGELVALFGTDLGPPAGASAKADASGKIGTNLEGVRVLFDGIPAPVLYAQSYQINAIVPFGITPKNGVQVQVEYSGNRSAAASVTVAEAAPAVFTLNPPSPRGGKAAVLNQDGTINSPDNPAAVGSVVVIYATGAGQMQPAIPDGKIATDTSAKPALPVSVLFNYATSGEVLYAGPAPGNVAGVLQINARVPELFCGVPNCHPDLKAISVIVGIGKPDPSNDPNGIVPVAKYRSQVLTTIAVR